MSRIILWGFAAIVLVFLAFMAYKNKGILKSSKDIVLELNEKNAGIDGMAQWLAAYDKIIMVPANSYADEAVLRQVLNRPKPDNPEKLASWNADIARAYLKCGQQAESFPYFEAYFDIVNQHPELAAADEHYQEFLHFMKHLQAVSFMRFGEIANCVAMHNEESCIFPLQGKGIHTDTFGAATAYRMYLDMLSVNPNDNEAVWLLNVAAMALGIYPDSVPADFILSPDLFASKYDIGRFTDVAPGAGVSFSSLSGGVCMDDFDNDGYLDIITSGWQLYERIAYFHNNGDGTYADWSASSGIGRLAGGLNMVHADYNNDGFKDVLILRGGWWDKYGCMPNSLLRNNGDGTFEDVTFTSGMTGMHPSQTARFEDFNNDGWLDIFVGSESSKGSPDHPCQLYLNNGKGGFKDVAAKVGVNVKAYVKGAGTADYDNDGDMDIVLSVYQGRNILLRNDWSEKKELSFTDVTKEAGIAGPFMSFPAWFFDYNNDGFPDIFIASFYQQSMENVAAFYRNKPFDHDFSVLYKNNGDGTFSDVSVAAGVQIPALAMGCNFGDLDNDGWLDFYLGTGNPDYRSLVPNLMFRNDGEGRFQDVTSSGGFGHLQKGHGIAFGDADRDGDQDVYAVLGGAVKGDFFWNALFQNPGHGNHYVNLKLTGTSANRDAIGARVIVHCMNEAGSSRKIYRTVNTGGSFGSAPLERNIGLGQYTLIEKVEIIWPGTNTPEVITGLQADHSYLIKQGTSTPEEIIIPAFEFKSNEGHVGHHM